MVVTWAYNAGTNTATASGAGSTNFAALVAADTAGGWGKFTADATGTQIICNAKIVIGDGATATTFSDSGKEILFLAGVVTADSQKYISVKTNSTVTFGTLVDEANKVTKNGCTFISLEASKYYASFISYSTSGITNLYSCTFQGLGARIERIEPNGRVWNCILINNCQIVLGTSITDYFNNMISGTTTALESNQGNFDKLSILGETYGIKAVSNYALGLKNIYIRNTTYIYVCSGTRSISDYLINVDSNTWAFYFTGSTHTGKIYRQYEFDLQVCDNAESEAQGTVVPIEGADVTLFDKDGNEVFNATSGADGWIATQIVSRGYYAQATGDTLQDYGPHFLLVTADGYEPYMDEYILTEKRTNQISMNYPGVPADLATATPTDVLTGKTFFGKAGTLETGTLVQSSKKGGSVVFVPQEVEVPNKQEKDMKELIKVLIQQKQFLRKQQIKQNFEPNKIPIN